MGALSADVDKIRLKYAEHVGTFVKLLRCATLLQPLLIFITVVVGNVDNVGIVICAICWCSQIRNCAIAEVAIVAHTCIYLRAQTGKCVARSAPTK